MPSVSERRAVRARSQTGSSPSTPQRLRPPQPQEIESLNNKNDRDAGDGQQPQEIDEPWLYSFCTGDPVWIRTPNGDWQRGVVSGQAKIGQTRQKEGLFYPVVYCEKTRKYFAPLNGDIKPDEPYTRRLLEDAGWL